MVRALTQTLTHCSLAKCGPCRFQSCLHLVAHRWFQSSSAITGGRDWSHSPGPPGRPCFNPRPPLLAGETSAVLVKRDCPEVSIHARHYWRARPFNRGFGRSVVKFQSTPAITGGRDAHTPRVGRVARRFNPRPPLLAGETASAIALRQEPKRFNPRPPLLAGETDGGRRFGKPDTVSIHARHYWRARPPRSMAWPRQYPFQSTPAITGGRDRSRQCGASDTATFQSTPAITGGRDNSLRIQPAPGLVFQSTPAITGGRDQACRPAPSQPRCFNPRPPLLAGETVRA